MTARVRRLPLPSAEYLRECFSYDPETGELIWRERPLAHFDKKAQGASFNAHCAHKPAGCPNSRGYRSVYLTGIIYQAHRIVWKLVTGDEPPIGVDHHDRDKTNNRWRNLRPATQQEQTWNSGDKSSNTSGFRGVWPRGRRWRARISENGVYRNLGTFNTAEEAHAAYERAARELHGEFYREAVTTELPS